MPNYRLTFQMALKNQEWGYVFGIVGDSAPSVIASIKDSAFENAILSMHANGVELAYIEAHNLVTRQRDTKKLWRRASKGAHGDLNPDVTNNSAIFTRNGVAGAQAKLTLSGLPDSYIERDTAGNPVINAAFQAAIDYLKPRLLDSGACIIVTDPPGADGPTAFKNVRLMEPDKITIGGEQVVDDSYTVFTLSGTDHGIQVGDMVQFARNRITKETRGLGGEFKVVERSASYIKINTVCNFRGDSFMPRGLRVRKITESLEDINDLTFDDFTSRQRGEGGGPRGKRQSISYRH